MSDRGFHINQRVLSREDVFNKVSQKIKDKQCLYLEFGVFQGESIKYWSNALKNPKSILHGFDSFIGLPENWDVAGGFVKGTFSTNGEIPKINDDRVTFFKGFFDETLPKYDIPDHDLLIVIMDADLYSSTKLVLEFLLPYIKPGDYLYFDDLARPDHEFKAFSEFIDESELSFVLVAADFSLNHAFFKCVDSTHKCDKNT
jgi:hypothetical protein